MKNFTDTSEHGLQRLILDYLVDENGYVETKSNQFDHNYYIFTDHLFNFIQATQPDAYEYLQKGNRSKFLARLHKKLSSQGVVKVLRKGIKFNNYTVKLFYSKPASQLNSKDQANYAANIFSVTEELIFTKDHNKELDLVIAINGIPLITAELKNPLTNQNYRDAIKQYKTDRNPKDKILNFARCLVHFAADTQEVHMTTALKGQDTRFLPFNKGLNDGGPEQPFGKGNPKNPQGVKTAYLWEEVLTKDSLSNIISHFAQLITKRKENGAKSQTLIFPRYHQLTAVRKLLNHTQAHGVGQRYLIQHSTGSGKSFSITWLTYQLANLFEKTGEDNIFDSVIVVTDRRNLDEHIKEQLKSFTQIRNLVEAIDSRGTSKSQQLAEALSEGKKIIVVTVQTFPFVLEKLGSLPEANYAIVIDEAHSSQSGTAAAEMNATLNSSDELAEEVSQLGTEDYINNLIKQRKMLDNASYYAFTATPKNKTLETFGQEDEEGRFYPFHLYPMKQAIEEGFILDTLKNYTTYTSYYKVAKTVEDNPEFDVKEANKRLRVFVEAHPETIQKKAKIMIDHFHNEVAHLIDGEAKAMVVTKNIHSAMKYKDAFDAYLDRLKSPYRAIVAFSGTKAHYKTGEEMTESKMNNFEDAINDIPEQFKKDKYRFLIVAEKYQTGFDQPLLHTMYVDKNLGGLQAVQTLSRLNRSHPNKNDTFVLDFYNEPDEIKKAFEPYYTATLLSEATDPNRLNDLQDKLDEAQVYTEEDLNRYFEVRHRDNNRAKLEAILQNPAHIFKNLEEDTQSEFKAGAKSFVRTYSYLSKLIDFENHYWEKLFWFLAGLIPLLKIEGEDDEDEDILEFVDIDNIRPAKKGTTNIYLDDEGQVIEPIPLNDSGQIKYEVEKETLDSIIDEFNQRFGDEKWKNEESAETLAKTIPEKLQEDETFKNAPDRQNAKEVSDRKVKDIMKKFMMSQTEIYQKFMQDEEFQDQYLDYVFEMNWQRRS